MPFDAILLANGAFPKRQGAARRLLATARRVVACDGAAAAYRRCFRKWPDAIVGDLDSLSRPPRGVDVVRVDEQETNDFEKAVRWCRRQGWKRLAAVGATGKREDHALGNIFRALDLDVEIVTDSGRFVPVASRAAFRVSRGTAVSIFAPDARTRMTSSGLKWPLDGVRFDNLYRATLNEAVRARVELTTTRPVMVYLAT